MAPISSYSSELFEQYHLSAESLRNSASEALLTIPGTAINLKLVQLL
jgi:hypothetical protein